MARRCAVCGGCGKANNHHKVKGVLYKPLRLLGIDILCRECFEWQAVYGEGLFWGNMITKLKLYKAISEIRQSE